MPPKQFCFKINGVLQYEEKDCKDEFCMFFKAIDDRHAVMLVREHLEHHAPKGKSVIRGIEKKSE